MSPEGIARLKEFEGLRLKPYLDSAGYGTIGWGHRIKPHESFTAIDVTQAERLLKGDIAIAEKSVSDLVKVPLSQWQQDSLICFVFNIGRGAFYHSTMLRKLNKGDYEGAAKEFDRWIYAGGEKLQGLINRRKAEREMFEHGGDPAL